MRYIKIFLLFLSVVFTFLYCRNRKTEIYKLNVEKREYDKSLFVEYYVVSNPPKNSNDLLTNVKKYNLKNLPHKQNLLNAYTSVVQVFYDETWSIDRDYKPNSFFFDIDDIRDSDCHAEDKILVITLKSTAKACNTCPNPPNYIFFGKYDESGMGEYK
jgi:hypothetical protein